MSAATYCYACGGTTPTPCCTNDGQIKEVKLWETEFLGGSVPFWGGGGERGEVCTS